MVSTRAGRSAVFALMAVTDASCTLRAHQGQGKVEARYPGVVPRFGDAVVQR